MSKKRRASLPERERVRLEVFERDGGRCQFWFVVDEALERITGDELCELPMCFGVLTPHHLMKSWKGPYIAENLLTLCVRHNKYVEEEPDLCYRLGLTIRNGDPLPWEAA